MKLKRIIITLLLFCHIPIFAQLISGTVYDKITNEVLSGATIYLDGTSIGVISNLDGEFELNIKNSTNSSLVISYIGYRTVIVDPENFKKFNTVYLQEIRNQLKEVVLEIDNWSRVKKMRIFKSEFLGSDIASQYCKILNEKDITIIYIKSKNTLTAFSENPIIIKNKYLGYEINYNLVDFEVQFAKSPDGMRYSKEVYLAGSSFFKDLSNKTKKKILKRREHEFKGSLIHFMRSLVNHKITENKFDIYVEGFIVPPYKYFNFTNDNSQTKVYLEAQKLSILYKQNRQSSIEFKSSDFDFFHIDDNGNHSPPNSLLFGGEFGSKRISSSLPLNYSSIIR